MSTTTSICPSPSAALRLERNRAALPAFCYSRCCVTGRTVLLRFGIEGQTLAGGSADDLNRMLMPPPTRQQVAAMEVGAMFGWSEPGAHPDHPIHAFAYTPTASWEDEV